MKNTALTKPESELCLKCDAKVCLSEQCKQPQKIVASDFILNIFSLGGFVVFALIAFFTGFFIDIPLIGESVLLGCLVAGILGMGVGHLIGKYVFPLFMKQWKKNKPCKVEELRQREKEQEAKRNDPKVVKRQINGLIEKIKRHQESLEKENNFQKYQDQIDILKQATTLYEIRLIGEDITIFDQSLDFLLIKTLSIDEDQITNLISEAAKKQEEAKNLQQKLSTNIDMSSTSEGKKCIQKLEEVIKICEELKNTLRIKTTNLLVNGVTVHRIANFEEKLKELKQAKDRILKHSFEENAQLERNLESILGALTESNQETIKESSFRFTRERPKEPIYRK